MALSMDLIREFAKVVNDKPETNTEKTVTGTAVEYAGKMFVRLDGSDGQLTPVITTAGMKDGDRVTVVIKEHTATVTGNTSSPSAGKDDIAGVEDKVDDVVDQISEFEIIIADKVSTEEFDAEKARIDELVADNVVIKGELDATKATIGELEADNVTINEKLTAAEADIDELHANMLTAEVADLKYATIENLEATNADIHNLEADYGSFKELTTEKFTATDAEIENIKADMITVDELDAKYANIDFANIGSAAIENFFSKSGMIGDLVVGDGTITGTLVGVTIKGDLIEGGTVKADKLVVQGEDGLYYKLNVTGEKVEAEQTEYNSLNGSIITAKSITATKISVDDLVAFDATIGGFKITESSLYSGVKESIDNTTRGVYMDDTGQFALGDQTNYLKYFYDESTKTWKLDISAQSIKFGVKGESIEDAINNATSGKLVDTVSGNGVLVADQNGGKKPYELKAYGQTKQNLWVNPSGTKNGVTVTSNEDGSMTLGGVASANEAIYARTYILKPGTAYHFSVDAKVSDYDSSVGLANQSCFQIVERKSDGIWLISHEVGYGSVFDSTFVTRENTVICDFRLAIKGGDEYSGTYRVMLREATEEEISGVTSEEFDWCPPGLSSISELALNMSGKNLWKDVVMGDIKPVDGGGIKVPANGSAWNTGSRYNVFIPKGTKITLSKSSPDGFSGVNGNCGPGVFLYNAFGVSTTSSFNVYGTNTSKSITVTEDIHSVIPYWNLASTKETLVYVQLELGTEATAYEPYVGSSTPIDLKGNILPSLPDGSRDVLTVDANGARSVNSNVLMVEVNGGPDEWWQDYQNSGARPGLFGFNIKDATVYKLAYPQVPLCNLYAVEDTNGGQTYTYKDYMCGIDQNGNFWIKDPRYTSLSEFKTYLKTAGIKFFAKRQAPQTVELDTMEMPELPAPTANVWLSVNDTLNPDFDLTYWTENGKTVADAQDSANNAQNSADNAQNTADNAQSSADKAQDAADKAQSDIDGLEVGGKNLLLDSKNFASSGVAAGLTNTIDENGYYVVKAESGNSNWVGFYNNTNRSNENIAKNIAKGDKIVFSLTIKSEDATVVPKVYFASGMGYYQMQGKISPNWSTIYYAGEWVLDHTTTQFHLGFSGCVGTYVIKDMKLEKGNKATDWTPAPEDMATADDLQTTEDQLTGKLDETNTLIEGTIASLEVLDGRIQSLVRGPGGESMITQHEDGIYFDFTSVQDAIDSAAENITSLEGDVDKANAAINEAQGVLDSVAEKTAYINLTTIDGLPAIELGKSDSAFKLRITNEKISFLDNSKGDNQEVAYISNNKLYIETAVIKNELKIGEDNGFVWRTRSNGNMGLRWEWGGKANLIAKSKIPSSEGANKQAYGFASRNLAITGLKANTKYTLTANGRTNAKTTDDQKYLRVIIYSTDWKFQYSVSIKETSDTTKSITFTTPSDIESKKINITSYYYPSEANSGVAPTGTCTVNWYKLEEGDKSTAWRPAAGEEV